MWTIQAENGRSRKVETKAEANNVKHDMQRMGMNCEIIPPDETAEDTNTTETENEHTETQTDGGPSVEQSSLQAADAEVVEDIPDSPDIDKDPVEWLPAHFIDQIQGVPTINRKGYCVLCSQFDVSVSSQAVTRSSETDFEYAEFEATAIDADGNEYSGFGTAHIERDDDKFILNELAETRAMKRAATWATGIGITAIEEME